jgi:tetratricopeptide (TPR) repeat protein
VAALLDAPAHTDYERRIEQAEEEMDNLLAAFVWSLESGDVGRSLELATSLQPLWFTRGRIREGLAWFDAALRGDAHQFEIADAVRARALADKAVLDAWVAAKSSMDLAQQAMAIARELDDPALMARALTACGVIAGYYDREEAQSYFAEAIRLARAIGDRWRLSQILALQAQGAAIAGDPSASRAAAEEGQGQFASVPFLARVGARGKWRFGRRRQTIGRGGGRVRGGSR